MSLQDGHERQVPLHTVLEHRLFHGTAMRFKPGDVIQPPTQHGGPKVWNMSKSDRVYATVGTPHYDYSGFREKVDLGDAEDGIRDAASWADTAMSKRANTIRDSRKITGSPFPHVYEVEPVGKVEHDINLSPGHAVVAEGMRVKRQIPHPDHEEHRQERFGLSSDRWRLEQAANKIITAVTATPVPAERPNHPILGKQW